MSLPHFGLELPPYLAHEVTAVQEAPGAWRVFIMELDLDARPSPVTIDPFLVPTFPTEEAALDFAAILLWEVIDGFRIFKDGRTQQVPVLD